MQQDSFLKLKEGNELFRNTNRDFRDLAEKQEPEFVIISCSDSRVTPSTILNSRLGEIFEIRTAGGVIDETAVASVEFALESLGTRKVIFMAHTGCGAVTSAFNRLSGQDTPGTHSKVVALSKFVDSLSEELQDIFGRGGNLDDCILQNASNQMKKLLESEKISSLLERREIILATGIYDLGTGRLVLSPFPE